MKKGIKNLVGAIVIGTLFITPAFAKHGDMYYNEQLGIWLKEVHMDGKVYLENQSTGGLVEKGAMKSVATYTLGQEVGMRTINAVVKNGVSMVSVQELADAMDLELKNWDTCYNLSGYSEYGGIIIGMNIYKPGSNAVKDGIYYTSGLRIMHASGYKVNPAVDIKFAPKNAKFEMVVSDFVDNPNIVYSDEFVPYTDVNIEGAFSVGKAEYINDVLYVPAKEVINLINQEVTDVIYDKNKKTISFEKKNQYYNKTVSYIPY